MTTDTMRRPGRNPGVSTIDRREDRHQSTARSGYASELLDAALDYAATGWPVFPAGRTKRPRIVRAHPPGVRCRGECGRDGHGFHDGTTDPATVRRWWGVEYPGALIAARIPGPLIVVDTDPRHGGEDALRALAAEHGATIPATLTAWSGRNDGGRHRYYLHPGGRLTGRALPEGVDLKTPATGYTILPPSRHPSTGRPYWWDADDVTPVPLPGWFVDLLRPPPPPPPRRTRPALEGESPADWYTATSTWRGVLAGWSLVAGDGETDGSKWRHPAATNTVSAQVLHGLLFCYSPGAGLPVCEGAAAPNGLTRFRAWAWLEHGGDLPAAARAAMALRDWGEVPR